MEKAPLVIGFVIGVIVAFLGAWFGHSLAAPARTVTVTVTASRPPVCGVSTPTTITVTRVKTVTRSLTTTTLSRIVTTVTRTITVMVRPRAAVSVPPKSGARVLALLVESEYDSYVLKLIEHANRSVYVMMFVAKYYPHHPTSVVDRILYALCRDHRRGVDVKVLLDYTTYVEYRQTIEFLKSCGVPVKVWHECGYLWRLHAKVVIVDGKIVVLGSHNWTYSALAHNIEVSVAIYSPKYATELTKLFNSLWKSACSFSP